MLTPDAIAALAHRAMLMEVGASPKPGLVCPDHNGSHTDMDHALFVASAHALLPYLGECATIGLRTADQEPDRVFPLLRQAGVMAERAMFAATGGINTHKGMIFSLGLAAAGAGRTCGKGYPLLPERVAQTAGSFVQGIVARDLEPLKTALPNRRLTAGETLYREHGVPGIRKEAEDGFPAAVATCCRLLEHGAASLAHALPHELLRLIIATDDTNILWRGGPAGLRYAKAAAAEALDKGGMFTPEGQAHIFAMRDEFVHRNLSPGGCADLLALAVFFFLLHEEGRL